MFMRYLMCVLISTMIVDVATGCSSPPLDVPACDKGVILCEEAQARDGLRCASCTDPDSTLSCKSPNNERIVCVSDCHACDHEPSVADRYDTSQLDVFGVHACGHAGYGSIPGVARDHAWCATCSDYDLTMTTRLCVDYGTNLCDPVVCVRTCDSCNENIVGQRLVPIHN